MKKILLSSVTLLGLSAVATAADLPRRQYVAPAPVVAVPVFTWTGFYVGVNAGYGFSDRNDYNLFNNFAFGSGLSVPTITGALAPVVPTAGFGTFGNANGNRDGFVGGGQIGYNYQFTPGNGFVIGVEADIQYADFGRRRNDNVFDLNGGIFTASPVLPAVAVATLGGVPLGAVGIGSVAPGAPGNVALFNGGNGLFGDGSNNRHDWFATVRGRLGYAIDRLLIYGTGGVAFRDTNNDNGFLGGFASGAAVPANFYVGTAARINGQSVTPTNTFGFFNDRNNNDVGYAVGGGLEYAFTNNLTAKLEGLYVNFDRDRRNNGFLAGNNVVGVTNFGAPVFANQLGFVTNRNNDDFAVIRAGLNYKFGTF